MKARLHLLCIALTLVPVSARAHNGSLAVAVPVEGITVDGDLSDWPTDLQVYPIRENTDAYGPTDLSGTDLDISADFSPEFMVGYNLGEQLIYVAVRVRDDDVEIDVGSYLTTDACGVYLDATHGGMLYHYAMCLPGGSYRSSGANPSLYRDGSGELDMGQTLSRGAAVRKGDTTVYEWQFQLLGNSVEHPLQLAAGMTVGFDVVAVDKDADDDPAAWIAWGPGTLKCHHPAGVGDLLLVGSAADLGTISGQVTREKDGRPCPGLRIRAYQAGRAVAGAWSDTAGRYRMRLLPGQYSLRTGRLQGVAALDVTKLVQAGQDTRADILVRPTPPLLARLSFWVPPARMVEFEAAYEGQLAPLLDERGWVASADRGRATADSVFSCLFEVSTIYNVADRRRDLWGVGDPEIHKVLRQFGIAFGTDRADGLIRGDFRLYATPPPGPAPIRSADVREDTRQAAPQRSGYTVSAGPGVLRAEEGTTVEAGPGFRQGSWHTIGSLDGLPDPMVLDILHDRRGRLWFATGQGVARYDGQSFTTFTAEDGLAHTWVLCATEDRQGNLWFGSEVGVSRYDGERFTAFTVQDGLAHTWVLCATEDRQGNLWFGTKGGVSRYDGERFTTFTVQDGLAANGVTSIAEDRQGSLWFGTPDGLTRYDGQRLITFTAEDGLASNAVWGVLVDRQGRVWAGTATGVCRHDGERFTTVTSEELPDPPEGANGALFEDGDGHIWFGLSGGIRRYDGRQVTTFTPQDGLADHRVNAVFEDRTGHVWVATASGASRYEEGGMATFTVEDGLADNKVISLLEDRQGQLWVGTARGVSRYDGARFTTEKRLSPNSIRSMLEDRAGNLWFASWAGGLSCYDGERLTTFTTADGLPSDDVWCVLEDRAGDLWIGTSSGVSRYDGREFVTVAKADGLGLPSIFAALEDRLGNLWFGAIFGERDLTRYDGEQFLTLTAEEGLPLTSVEAIAEDPGGNLWFGGEGGVCRFDGQDFACFTAEDGLPRDYKRVRSILVDGEGNLWFGTLGEGISRYDGSEFSLLQKRHGLVNNSIYDILEDRSGDIWIATAGGLNRYRPNRISPGVPRIEVVTDRKHGCVADISLPSSQPLITFELHRSGLTTPWDEPLTYLYRLEGVDSTWRRTRQPRVEYTDLPRGEYVFRVSAIDRDLNRSEAPATVAVRVHLPYERIRMVSGLALAVLLIAWQAGRIVQRDRRVRQANLALSAANQQLQEKSTDLEEANRTLQSTQSQLVQAEKMATVGLLAGGVAHEINNPLQVLLDGAHRILRSPEDIVRHQQSASLMEQAAQRCSSIVQNLLNYTRRSKDEAEEVDLNEVVRSTLSLLQHNLQQADIQLRVDEGSPPILEGNFTELCTVVTNLVLNARDAALAMQQEDRRKPAIEIATSSIGEEGALLKVRDNGSGIADDVRKRIFDPFFTTKEVGAGTGLGLSIVDGIVKRHGGRIEVESEMGAGTTLLVYLSRGNGEGEPETPAAESDVGESA